MAKVEITQDHGYNFLWLDNYLWMWDVPTEIAIQKGMADKAYGRVLIAGYGLGCCQKHLLQNKNVTLVFTVEKYQGVLDECMRVYGEIHGVTHVFDFFDCRPDVSDSYDCVMGDIWDDIIPESLGVYKKFKAHAEKFLKPNGKIIAWGQEFFEYLIYKERK